MQKIHTNESQHEKTHLLTCGAQQRLKLLHKKQCHVINSRALTREKPCINKAIHTLLMHDYATFSMLIPGHRIVAVTRCVLPCPRTSIVLGNSVRATSLKRPNKIVQEITQNVANVFSFYAIIAIKYGFSMH